MTGPKADVPHVIIVGGGLAGLAAATALAPRGMRITLLESRPRLGGRASSIHDRDFGQPIDNCQHVAMGCCTNFLHFCETIGCLDLIERQRELYFIGPPEVGRRSPCVPFRGANLPAPLHLASSLAAMPWLTWRDKLKLGFALRALAHLPDSMSDVSCADWLQSQGQSPAAIEHFWNAVLVSALSERLDCMSLRHARKVFVDGFLMNRSGWEVSVPRVALSEIYETHLSRWLANQSVDVRLKTGVKQLHERDGSITHVELRTGEELAADAFVLAVPQNLIASMVPPSLAALPVVQRLSEIKTAPIASVHLWFDRPLTTLPHAVLLGRLSQWIFNRSNAMTTGEADRSYYYQVVISAAFELSAMPEATIVERICDELRAIWPEAHGARLLASRMITEHRAVFSPRPGVDDLRAPQQSPLRNLQFAGDWTITGWPATMEGAVRSGYLAAENILKNAHQPAQFVQPNLPSEWLASLLYGQQGSSKTRPQ